MRNPLILIFMTSLLFAACSGKKQPVQEGKKSGGETMQVMGVIASALSKSDNISSTGTILPGEKVDLKSEISGRVVSLHFREGGPVKKGQLLVKLDDSPLLAEKKKLTLQVEMEAIKERRQKQLLAAKAISQEEYDLTEANLNILKANIDIINTQISKTSVFAPFNGVAGFRNISVGAMVSPADVIVTIHDIQPVKIEFSIPEKLSKDLKVGKNITLHIAADKKERTARIYAIDPQIDPGSRSLVLRAEYANTAGDLLPGSFADIKIPEATRSEYIAIPSMAYVPDISGALVYLRKNGMVTPVKVIAASRSESLVYIESGIEPGDTVITSGLLQIKPGMPVNVRISDK